VPPSTVRVDDADAAAPTPRPIVLPDWTNQTPAWRQPEIKARTSDPLAYPRLVALGKSTAIAKTAAGYFAIGKMGVVGPLALPNNDVWVGLGGQDDRILFAHNGSLYEAGYGPDATRRNGFHAVATVDGATHWDVAEAVVVAASKDKLWKGELGQPLKEFLPLPKEPVTDLRVRADGTIAILVAADPAKKEAPKVLYTAKPKTNRLVKSRYQSTHLDRRGSWILDGSRACPVVLSADGRRWLKAREDLYESDRDWTDQLRRSLWSSPKPRPPLESFSKVPRRGREVRKPLCARVGIGGMRGRSVNPIIDYSWHGVFGRVRHSWGPKAKVTDVSVGFLNDRFCSVADQDSDQCKDGSKSSSIHFAVTNGATKRAHIATLPKRCNSIRIGSHGGLPLVVCKTGDELEMLVFDGKTLVSELKIKNNAILHYLGFVAEDGTLAVSSKCPAEDQCEKSPHLVRSPVAAGSENAWREISQASAVAHRLLPGGRVLAMVVEVENEQDATVSFEIEESDGTRTTLVKGVHIRGHVLDFFVDDARRITLKLGTRRTDPMHGNFVVVDDGSLLEVP